MVTTSFCRSAQRFLSNGGNASHIDQNEAAEWLDDIRDRIDFKADTLHETPKTFAATLVGCVATAEMTIIIHVGDGACVLRRVGSTEWQVPSWPAQGEFAATTFFVTDDPQCQTTITKIEGQVEEIALFSDASRG